MKLLKKLSGHVLYSIAQLISSILNIFISLVEFIVGFVSGVAKGIVGFLGMGGCLLLFLLGPFGIMLLLNPVTLLIILFFVVFPILGTKFVSYLKYLRYMLTEYLFDRANNLIDGKKNRYKSFNEYGTKYKGMEQDRIRKEQQQRQEEQQRQWEERFRQWNEYQKSQRGYEEFGGYWQNGQNTGGYGNQQPYVNPGIEFKNKYEKSCDFLSVGYDADKYQVKLAYRKKAKQYHPDINKSPDATKMFQQINDAYEFLSDDNIERYKTLG